MLESVVPANDIANTFVAVDAKIILISLSVTTALFDVANTLIP